MRNAVRQHRRIIDLAITGRLAEAEVELSSHVGNVESLAMALLTGPSAL
jgi:DNA-binding GntR family transcriptional regulator